MSSNLEGHAELRDADAVALGNGLGEGRDRLVARPEHRHALALDQLGDAAGVVGMVVRGEDRAQTKLLAREIIEHRPRVARVDDRGVARITQRPNIVVLERIDRHDLHDAAILRAKRGAKV
jgi:hypothetical protein